MKKHIALMLLACAASPMAVGVSHADPMPEPVAACTSDSRDAEVPSGSTADANGRTWVGFKAGGLPPDSLSKSSTATVCEDYPEPPPP